MIKIAVKINFWKNKIFAFLKIKKNYTLIKKEINLESSLANAKLILFHVGLKNVDASSPLEAYNLILKSIRDDQNYAIPAFTPSFRSSHLFSLEFSCPEVGKFSQLAFYNNFFRTKDPIHSLFLKREIQFDALVINDTFHKDGIYSLFIEPGSYWVNIGTNHLVSTVLHYLERVAGVPYLTSKEHHGYFHDSSFEKITHKSYQYTQNVTWNRKKIETDLIKAGAIIEKGTWNGASCIIIDAEKASKLILQKLQKNPYYLVM